MTIREDKIAAKLKEIIDENGPYSLTKEPYQVYRELICSEATDQKTAGVIFYALVSGITDWAEKGCSIQDLSGMIQKECCLKKSMAEHLSQIFSLLYTMDNRERWEKKEKEGLQQFLSEEFSDTWEGFSVWDAGSVTVDCDYKAEIILKPLEDAGKDEELVCLLKQNPFTAKDEITGLFQKRLNEYLDAEFEEYCTCDDYYPPVVEDFEIEYCVEAWCRKNGFKVISCAGNGSDSGYEPKSGCNW